MTTGNGSHGSCLALAVLCIQIAACTDDSRGSARPLSFAPTSPPNAQVSPVRYSPEELHRRNPADWVGVAHNRLLTMAAEELKKPGVRFSDLCSRLQQRLSEPYAFKGTERNFPSNWRNYIPQAVGRSPLCKRGAPFQSVSGVIAPVAVTDDFSPAAYALMADAEAAVDVSDDPTELAGELSPILDAASSLDPLDEEGVQAVVAVTQSSFEYWYDNSYAALEAAYDEVDEELSGCANGTMEDEQCSAGGNTYQCEDLEWRLIRLNNPRPETLFPLAALMPRSAASCPSQEERHSFTTNADVGGSIVGAFLGIGGGGGGVLAMAFVTGSASSIAGGFFHAVARWFCLYVF